MVTCKYWDDLWLNEGFARFMEYMGTHGVRPTWRMDDQLVGLQLDIAQNDAINTTRPVSLVVNTPSEIEVNFFD